MSNFRAQFLEDLERLELLMSEFNKGYPYNFGQVFRRYRFIIFVVLATIVCIQVLGGCGGFLLFVIVVGWRLVAKKIDKDEYEIQVTIVDPAELERATVAAESKYAEYPDVMRFLKQFRAEWEAEKKRKKNIIITWCIMGAVCLVAYAWMFWL